MTLTHPLPDRKAAFVSLREAMGKRHHGALEASFVPADDRLVPSGIATLDRAIGGGFSRGLISSLEGAGCGLLASRLLAHSTQRGLAALIERPDSPLGRLAPAALESAGVRLERLLIVHAGDDRDVARATDIILRAEAFGLVVIPAVPLRAPEWTRLASLAHRADAVLLTLGSAPSELRFFASLRVGLQRTGARFLRNDGPFGMLAGFECEGTVLKHKRFSPGRTARFVATTFQRSGPPLSTTRERALEIDADRLRVRAVV